MDRILLAFVSLLLITQPTFARDPLDPQDVEKIISEFQYVGNYKEIRSSKSGGAWSSCWVYEKEYEADYPGAAEPLKVSMKLYIPNRDSLKEDTVPAVIMVPPIGGVNLLDRRMADTICSNDMAALILANDFANIQEQAEGKLRPPEDHHETFYRIAGAIKGAMAFIDDDANLDYDRIGIFGVSLGGILSSFVMATQPDISAGYFMVSGGDIPQILANSTQDEVSRIRRKRMQQEGLKDRDEYEAYLRSHISLDPIDISMTMLPETLEMVISERDTHVPSSNQELLHKAFGQPKAVYSNDGHVGTVLSFLFPSAGRRRVANFFKDRFAEKNPRPSVFNGMDQGLSVASP